MNSYGYCCLPYFRRGGRQACVPYYYYTVLHINDENWLFNINTNCVVLSSNLIRRIAHACGMCVDKNMHAS